MRNVCLYFLLLFRMKKAVHFFISALIIAHLCIKTVTTLLLSFRISLLPFGRGEEKERMNWKRPNIFSGKNLYSYLKHHRKLEDSGTGLKLLL